MSSDAIRDTASLEIPKGVSVKATFTVIHVKGPKGTIERPFPGDVLSLKVQGPAVTLTLLLPANRKRSKALLHTWEAHVRNLAQGVSGGFVAKMKAVSAHFPMKVAVKDGRLVIENFLGEKFPRSAALLPGVTATVEAEIVTLTGPDIELVGQSAANIERATRIRDYDPRVFQDGIYLIERAHPAGAA